MVVSLRSRTKWVRHPRAVLIVLVVDSRGVQSGERQHNDCMKRHLFRFKSNPKTIVHLISETLVQVVWSETFMYCDAHAWIYQYDTDNLCPLTDAEVEGVLHLRSQKEMNNLNIGLIAPPPLVVMES